MFVYWFGCLTSLDATTKVKDRRRGATLILPCIMREARLFWHHLMQGFFHVQESKGDLTRGHYFRSPPIEQRSQDFCTPEKSYRFWPGLNPRPRAYQAERYAIQPLNPALGSWLHVQRLGGICIDYMQELHGKGAEVWQLQPSYSQNLNNNNQHSMLSIQLYFEFNLPLFEFTSLCEEILASSCLSITNISTKNT